MQKWCRFPPCPLKKPKKHTQSYTAPTFKAGFVSVSWRQAAEQGGTQTIVQHIEPCYLRGMGYANLSGCFVMSVFFMCLLPTPCAPETQHKKKKKFRNTFHQKGFKTMVQKKNWKLPSRTNVFLLNAGSFTTSSYVTRSNWSNTKTQKKAPEGKKKRHMKGDNEFCYKL